MSCSDQVRGINGGGNPNTNVIEYITIAQTGNGVDFGDLTVARQSGEAFSSSTRGVFAGGYIEPTFSNTIDFVTIASTGNATDFGDLTLIRMMGGGGCSNSTRGIIGGGQSASPAPRTNIIDFIKIATTGNAVDFGDQTSARTDSSGASSSTRGVFVGGDTPTLVNTIDFVEIATTGDAVDFGDQTTMRDRTAGASNGHGGL
jgi:hypothetical protein